MLRFAFLGFALSLAACDPANVGDSGPMVVDCSFFFEGETTTLRYGDGPVDPLQYGDLTVDAGYSDPEFDVRSFSVSIYSEDGSVGNTVLYQFAGDEHPVNEFAGDHGFTGLNWVRDPASGENIQYACFARRPSEPVKGWEE